MMEDERTAFQENMRELRSQEIETLRRFEHETHAVSKTLREIVEMEERGKLLLLRLTP